jgi:hypothetical protein
MREPTQVTASDIGTSGRSSLWQKIKRAGLNRLLVVCVGIGVGVSVGLVAIFVSFMWLTARPIPAREWPGIELDGAGLKANLKTDWNNSVRYQLVVKPLSEGLEGAFDNAVRSNRDSISFTVHLYDKAGFELCKQDVKPTPLLGTTSRIDGLHANDTFGLDCSRSSYRETDHWTLSYVFPALGIDVSLDEILAIENVNSEDRKYSYKEFADAIRRKYPASELYRDTPDKRLVDAFVRKHPDFLKSLKTENQPRQGRESSLRPAMPPDATPLEGDDTMTGFDLVSGNLEMLSGKTFLVYREGERGIANRWNNFGLQPPIHFSCKTKNDCLIEKPATHQTVHGKLLR